VGLWFAGILDLPPARSDLALAAGRLAWHECDAARRWPHWFLSATIPLEVSTQLARFAPSTPPAVLAGAMPEAVLEEPVVWPGTVRGGLGRTRVRSARA
jgi:hypothetical protein